MAVYSENGGYEKWSAKLDRDFGAIVEKYIAEYNDKSIEELYYAMTTCVHDKLIFRQMEKSSKK